MFENFVNRKRFISMALPSSLKILNYQRSQT